MKINTKYIGCAAVIFLASLIAVPLTLYEVKQIGFLRGFWHGFTIIAQLVVKSITHTTLVASNNKLYILGYIFGLLCLIAITWKSIKKLYGK